jgi:hypothetical protein
VIAKVEAYAFPVIQLAFSSESLTQLQINDLVNNVVKPRLQTVTRVADVRIFDERRYAMRVWPSLAQSWSKQAMDLRSGCATWPGSRRARLTSAPPS